MIHDCVLIRRCCWSTLVCTDCLAACIYATAVAQVLCAPIAWRWVAYSLLLRLETLKLLQLLLTQSMLQAALECMALLQDQMCTIGFLIGTRGGGVKGGGGGSLLAGWVRHIIIIENG